jgi:hypothetical protein
MFNKRSYVLYSFLFLFLIISLSVLLWSFIAYSEVLCPTGQMRCGTAGCVSPLTDSKNCGVCGRICTAGLVCKDGTCVNAGVTKGGEIIKSGGTAINRNLTNPQPELPTKQIDTTKIKKFKPGKNDSAIAAPFIPGGTTVSDSISGLSELKDAADSAAGSNGIGSVSGD